MGCSKSRKLGFMGEGSLDGAGSIPRPVRCPGCGVWPGSIVARMRSSREILMHRMLLSACLAAMSAAANGGTVETITFASPLLPPNGDAAAKSIALFDDGSVAITALAPAGDGALFRHGVDGLEQGRYVASGPRNFSSNVQPVFA